MLKPHEAKQKLETGAATIKAAAQDAVRLATKATACAKATPARAAFLYDAGARGIPSSSNLSKVGFWSGTSSLLIGFPANIIGIAAGVAVEDRRRLYSKGSFKKLADKKVLLTQEELKRSRVGLAAGAVSLAVSLAALSLHLAKKR